MVMDDCRFHTRSAAVPCTVLPSAVAALALLVLATAPIPARAAETVTEVRVERVKPRAEKQPTLRFLRDNKDFLRAALDRTRQKSIEYYAVAGTIDPRFLAYRELMAQVLTDRDSVALANAAREKLDLLRSVTELGGLEAQLDQFDRLLAAQSARLEVLQRDFTGDQRTALAIVLSGYPRQVALSTVALTLDDGSAVSVPLTDDQRDALQKGGAVQVFHGYVEPREQVVQIALAGVGTAAGDAGYVTLEPARDRLTLLRLDLSAVAAGDGAPGIHASTWLNDARIP